MATVIDKRLCAGTMGTTIDTIYTAPSGAGVYVIIKAVTLCNKTSADATATLSFNGIEVVSGFTVLANDTITIPFIDQIIEAEELIQGLSGTADSINYYISGKEVTV